MKCACFIRELPTEFENEIFLKNIFCVHVSIFFWNVSKYYSFCLTSALSQTKLRADEIKFIVRNQNVVFQNCFIRICTHFCLLFFFHFYFILCYKNFELYEYFLLRKLCFNFLYGSFTRRSSDFLLE